MKMNHVEGTHSEAGSTNDEPRTRPNIREVYHSDIQLGNIIGKGSGGCVYKAKLRGKDCAAKIFKSAGRGGLMKYHEILSELCIASSVGVHNNLVQCFGACFDDVMSPILVMEMVDGEDLEAFLSRQKPGFNLGRERVQKWSLDILRALDFLHNRDPMIIHCDVKPANILLLPDRSSVKLADFGVARAVPRAEGRALLHGSFGTPRYMAPEARVRSGEACAITEKADIYSAGLVLCYLVTGRRPEAGAVRPGLGWARWRWGAGARVIGRMLRERPEERPSARGCIEELDGEVKPSGCLTFSFRN